MEGFIGSYHCNLGIDSVVTAVLKAFSCMTTYSASPGSSSSTNTASSAFGLVPKFAIHGGTNQQDLALQNIQARVRMVMSYLCAALLPWVRAVRGDHAGAASETTTTTAAATGPATASSAAAAAAAVSTAQAQALTGSGFLLVLGSGNVDEALRGYLTKYDCSSADINPIGGICKSDIRSLLLWAAATLKCPTLSDIVGAPPTAELRPLSSASSSSDITPNEEGLGKEEPATATAASTGSGSGTVVQTDEEDMGMSYSELRLFGLLRKGGYF